MVRCVMVRGVWSWTHLAEKDEELRIVPDGAMTQGIGTWLVDLVEMPTTRCC